jgi:VIT1/CCC1 family predicted Fe2+/Mn2+ transporter
MDKILRMQRDEITEYHIYKMLAEKDKRNRKVLERIAKMEKQHYELLRKYSGKEVEPDRIKVWVYWFLANTLGLVFALRLMESREDKAQEVYKRLSRKYPEFLKVMEEERQHEDILISLLKEEKLTHMSDVVLGLNDALVEITGTLAGVGLSINNNKVTAITGIVMGVAAAMSMAASNYLSSKERGGLPERAALYTGIAYLGTVALLVLPYLVLKDPFVALVAMLAVALLVIAFYNFYISVVKKENFRDRFGEMAAISLGVAAISYGVGVIAKKVLGVDV